VKERNRPKHPETHFAECSNRKRRIYLIDYEDRDAAYPLAQRTKWEMYQATRLKNQALMFFGARSSTSD
jgi:hypothetical protein